jgi:6-phosphogluconolactonase (cycloisomerase 2 family)
MQRRQARAARRRRTGWPLAGLVLTFVLLVSTAGQTWSAFTANAADTGKGVAAGSVVLTDNDGGNAMLSLSSAQPGDTDISCIRVSYSGTLAAGVRVYATIAGALAPYLTLKVWRGTDSSPSWDSCTNFTADATDYAGLGAGVLFDGNLDTFPSSFPTALVDPASATAAESWTTGEAHSFKFQITLQNNPAAQAKSGSATFNWEAHNAVTGFATQPEGTRACVTETGTGGACADGTALDEAVDVAVSPDGANVYAVTRGTDDSLLVFSRDATTGALTQLAGTSGCLSETGSGGLCTDGKGLVDAVYLTLSPDGASVYVNAYSSNGVAAFSRNSGTGALTQLAGTAGCVTDNGTGGTCTDGTALVNPIGVTVSPDGTSVYVTADASDAVAVFARNTGTGALTQLAGTAGCLSETGSSGACTDVYGLDGPFNVVISPDGRHTYVSTTWSGGVAVLTRNKATGALTQMPGTAGCVSDNGTGGLCQDLRGLWGPRELVLSPDGETLHVASEWSDTLTVLSRDPFSGRLSQSGAASACVSETGSGTCLDGVGLDGVFGLAMDPGGAYLYATSTLSDGLVVLRRAG